MRRVHTRCVCACVCDRAVLCDTLRVPMAEHDDASRRAQQEPRMNYSRLPGELEHDAPRPSRPTDWHTLDCAMDERFTSTRAAHVVCEAVRCARAECTDADLAAHVATLVRLLALEPRCGRAPPWLDDAMRCVLRVLASDARSEPMRHGVLLAVACLEIAFALSDLRCDRDAICALCHAARAQEPPVVDSRPPSDGDDDDDADDETHDLFVSWFTGVGLEPPPHRARYSWDIHEGCAAATSAVFRERFRASYEALYAEDDMRVVARAVRFNSAAIDLLSGAAAVDAQIDFPDEPSGVIERVLCRAGAPAAGHTVHAFDVPRGGWITVADAGAVDGCRCAQARIHAHDGVVGAADDDSLRTVVAAIERLLVDTKSPWFHGTHESKLVTWPLTGVVDLARDPRGGSHDFRGCTELSGATGFYIGNRLDCAVRWAARKATQASGERAAVVVFREPENGPALMQFNSDAACGQFVGLSRRQASWPFPDNTRRVLAFSCDQVAAHLTKVSVQDKRTAPIIEGPVARKWPSPIAVEWHENFTQRILRTVSAAQAYGGALVLIYLFDVKHAGTAHAGASAPASSCAASASSSSPAGTGTAHAAASLMPAAAASSSSSSQRPTL